MIALLFRKTVALAWFTVVVLHGFVAFWRFRIRKPEWTVAISTPLIGGVGGVERHLRSIIESMPNAHFVVFSQCFVKGGFIPRTWNYCLRRAPRRSAVYDIYLYLKSLSPPRIDRKHARKSVICPCGNDIREEECHFDRIALQADNGNAFSSQHSRCRVAIPDFTIGIPPKVKPVTGLPLGFFLTVFNPYGAVKGHETLLRVAPCSAHPIVWCYHTQSFGSFREQIPDVPNVVKLPNLSQRQLYYLYGRAEAYISFSLSEGFGWAIADAFLFDLPILSREVGFVTLVKDQPGVHLYGDESCLRELVRKSSFERPKYDKAILDRLSYRRLFQELLPDSK